MDTNNGTSKYDVVVIVPAYFNYSQCQATEDDETTAGLFELNIINESPMNFSCKVDEDDNDTHSIPTDTSTKMESVNDGSSKIVIVSKRENVTNKNAGSTAGLNVLRNIKEPKTAEFTYWLDKKREMTHGT